MTVKKQIVHGLKWQALNVVGKQVLSLVVATTLARLLSPSAFGQVALVGIYLGIVMMFVDQGIGVSLIQRQDLQPEHKDAAFWFSMGCAVVLCLGTMLLARPVAMMLGTPELTPLLRWASLGLVIGASSAIHATLFVRAMDFRRPVLRNLIANAIGGAVGVGMAFAGCGVWSLVGQQLASEIVGTIFLWSASSYRPALRFSLPHLRDLFGFSSSAFATSILWYFSTRLDQVIIGRVAGMHILGLYAIAGKIPSMANTITQQPLANVSLPSLSRLQNDHPKMREVVGQGMELNALISFAVFVGLAAVASDLVPVLFGAKWADAAVLCSLLSLYSLIEVLQVFFYSVLLASGGIGKYVWLNALQLIGVFTSCVVGIQFGVTYLVLGMMVNSFVIAIPGLLFLRQRIGLKPMQYCRPCLVPALASSVMVGAIWLLETILPGHTSSVLKLAGKVAVGGATYLAVVMLLAPLTLKKLAEMIGHAFRRSNILSDAPTVL